ncbi:MAG TPA: hypothetical protein VLI54_02945 [Bacillota bacterium]|nr:hypothetical protein [Bacillota bacterium]
MTFKQLQTKPIVWLYAAGVLLLLVAGWFWWAKVTTDPKYAFNAMLRQSLSTNGVTLQATQDNNGTTAAQTMQYWLGGQSMSHSVTSLSQTGTRVVDEMIGTPEADYTRYKAITTDQKSQSGKPLNLSKVVGVWAKNKGSGSGGLLSQAILGTSLPLGGIVVPMGDLTPSQRDELLTAIAKNKVYQASYKNVQRKTVHGRLQYTYNVTVKPMEYVRLLKNFAKDVGLHDLDQVAAESYNGQPDLKLRFTVDVHANHLVKVALAEGTYSQSYTSYDQPVTVNIPKKTVTSAQLQTLLQQMQQ